MHELSLFNYRAQTRSGRITRGTVAAKDEQHLHNQLDAAGLELLTCNAVLLARHSSFFGHFLYQVQPRDLIQLLVQLEQLSAAGVPLVQSLQNVAQSTQSRRLQDVLIGIERGVREGVSMSEAMASHPHVFDKFAVAMIASGEQSGKMVDAYRFLINYLKWREEMRSRVRKATRYPFVVITVVLFTIIIMMAYVVPGITGFFSNLSDDADLPFLTVALMATSDVFRAWWWAMVGGAAASAATILALRRLSEGFAYRTDKMLLNMPVCGPLIRKLNIARFVHTVSALYVAGIPLLDVLRTAADTLTNRVLHATIEEVINDMIAGQSLSEALTATAEFPQIVPLLIRTGEETGRIEAMLDQVAAFYNADIDEEVQKMITMIEPALTAILGGIILWIAVAVFGPVYELFEEIDF